MGKTPKASGQEQDDPTTTIGTQGSDRIDKTLTARCVDRHRRRFLLSSLGSALSGSIALNVTVFDEARAEPKASQDVSASVRIARDFRDPLLELVRLLSEAAEIEHDLMIQYLYAAFSLKPDYEALIGTAAPNAASFLGVAIQEMQHLAIVNRLLVALGAAPVLKRRDFPYEVDIYPFPFELEPLTANSLAKYVYCEAPAGTFSGRAGRDRILSDRVGEALGGTAQFNHVGTLYDRIIDLVDEVDRETPGLLKESQRWRGDLLQIKDEGEVGHFDFFKSVFMATHPAFDAVSYDPWEVPTYDARYPAYALPRNPTAYVGHPNAIADPDVRILAWLGNLSYWSALILLDLAYRGELDDGEEMAQQLMLGPLWSLARHLPLRGYGLPFDPLSMGSNLSHARDGRLAMLKRFLAEGLRVARRHEAALPSDLTVEIFEDLATVLPL